MKGLIIAWTLLFISVLAFGQYPNTGQKIRLGWQSSGDGLVYRGNGTPTYTPEIYDSSFVFIDTTAGTLYTYISGSWQLVSAGGGGGTSFDGHVDSLVFNASVTVVDSVGKMYYDAANETISVGIDGGAVYQMGQELYYPLVINKSGATILNGQPVMVDTATLVTGDHVRVIPARNGAAYPSDYVMGVATTDIPNDSTGLAAWFGYVREVKQSDIAQTGVTIDAGEILYLSSTEPGKYTDTPPTSPAHKSTIALVVRKPSVNNITLLVRPWLAPKLDNLSNVNVTSVTGLSVLRYNSTTGTWDASATPGIVAADTAAMLSNYVTLSTSQTITGTKTISNLLHRISGFTQDSFRLDYAAWPVSASQRIPYTISKGSGYYPSTGAMSTFMSRWNWGAVSDYNNASAFVFMGTDASGTGTLSNAAIAEYWNQYNSKALRIMANGRMAFGNFAPSYSLDMYGKTDGIRLPVGTTIQRPTGASGVLRFNSDSTQLEYHNGTSWRGIVNTWDAGTGGGGGSSVWTQSGSNVYVTGAKVGINTTSPNVMLEIDTSSNQVVPGGWGGNPEPKIVVNATAGKSAQIAINTVGTTAAAGIQFYSDGVPGADFGYVPNGEIGFANRADGKAVNFYTIGPRRQLSINPTYSSFRSPLYVGDSVKTGNVLNVPTSVLQVAGSFALNIPITVNASTYTVTYRDNWFICTYAGTTTFTLPDPSTCPGRILYFLNRANQTRLGSVAEIIPITGGSATQTIVANTSGKWVTLVSDGSVWQTLQGN